MSGGVDSSTAAYLLLKQGYEVLGVSLKLFNNNGSMGSSCCGIQGINDARGVAFKLGIPFYALNYVKEFEEKVIDYFSNEYKNGRTPNPCIMCNKRIKFESLLKKAKNLEADYVATGHYARINYDKETKRYILTRGKDKEKDQSYFLFSIPQASLKYSLFPLGSYTKGEVRKLAKKIGIKVHSKPASQEICFIPNNNYKSFLTEKDSNITKPGPIINRKGKVLGQHKGIAFYTVGQRKGLRISHKRPLYVLTIDRRKNTIVVGEKEETYSKGLIATNVNWVSMDGIDNSLRVKAKIRYNHKPAAATVSKVDKSKVRVKFHKPQGSITPGQAVVFYRRNTVVGGGVIGGALQQ